MAADSSMAELDISNKRSLPFVLPEALGAEEAVEWRLLV
jgi:hypothetical protein